MKIRYTRSGAAELSAILAHIEQHSPRGARKVHARIQAITELLRDRPYAGQVTSKRPLRRMIATPYPYLIFYEAADDEIIIHGIRHAARRPLL